MAQYLFSIPHNLDLNISIDRTALVNAVQAELNRGVVVKDAKMTTLATSKSSKDDKQVTIYFATKTSGEKVRVVQSTPARFAAWCLQLSALAQWTDGEGDKIAPDSRFNTWLSKFEMKSK